MKSLLVAALAAASFGVHAETFTFTSSGTVSDMVQTPGPNGAMRVATVGAFKGTTTTAGRSLTTESHCATWPSLPGDIFQSHGMCTFGDATGQGYLRYGCNPGKTAADADCVGGIWGTGGAYNGRNGTMAWHNRLGADGKSGVSDGAGQWGD